MGLFKNAFSYATENMANNNFINEIVDGLKHGNFSGEAGLYYELLEYSKNSFIEDDKIMELNSSDLIVPYLQLEYVSTKFYGFSIGAGVTGYMNFGKKLDTSNDTEGEDISDNQERDHFVMHELYCRYDISQTTLSLGRQKLEDSIFLSEYYKAFSITSNEIKNLSLFFAIIEEVAESDPGVLIEYNNIDRGEKSIDDYLYVAEATWNIMAEHNLIKFFYYHKGHHYSLYGAHVELFYETDLMGFGLNADIYETREDGRNGLTDDNDNVKNSDIFHISPFFQVNDFTFMAGYIEADRDVGGREGDLLDDYFNPFNEGDKVYDPDARTWYGTLSYETERINTELTYGITDYIDNEQTLTEKEINVNVSVDFMNDFNFETEFSIINSEGIEGNFKILEMALTYEF